ncbi:MAG: glycoside hydrolase family 88 protein [Verrucomicrobia bacterium]|nr:glycoside hydrolase family 88 protein [Verrucomicrobiota bacterium]
MQFFSKTIALLILISGLGSKMTSAEVQPEWLASVTVTSRVDFDAEDYPVTLPLDFLALTTEESAVIAIIDKLSGLPVPHQLVDTSGDDQLDAIFLVLSLAAGASKSLDLIKDPLAARVLAFPRRTQAELSIVQDDRFKNVRTWTTPPGFRDHNYQIRYEGPGWESDRIGYRLYLDNRNGIDIFGKRTPAMVLHTVGQDGYDSYHQPADWGMDILRVGKAVGLGSFGAWRNHAIQGLEDVHTRTSTVTANGPLLASHSIQYNQWRIGGRDFDLTANLSIQAGSHLTHVLLRVEPQMHLATGIVKLENATRLDGPTNVPEKDYTWIATWGDQSIIGDGLGMAVFYRPRDLMEVTEDAFNHVVRLRVRNGHVGYAFGAVWAQEPDSDWNPETFLEWCRRQALLLNRPPLLRITNRVDQIMRDKPLTAETVLTVAQAVANDLLARRGQSLSFGHFDPESQAQARWRYTTALLAIGFNNLWQQTGDQRYRDYALSTISSFVDETGTIASYSVDEYNIDHILGGILLLELYEATGSERYRRALDLMHEQMRTHPRTAQGGLWHKAIYPEQMWLDGLYMSAPFRARYAATLGHTNEFTDIAHQFLLLDQYALNPQTGLLHHAVDFARVQNWADPDTGKSPNVWSRAVGWYLMALVDTLEFVPENTPEHLALVDVLQKTVQAILPYQDYDTGLWFQVMDKPDIPGNYPETSSTSMFVYAIAKGINRGWLSSNLHEVPMTAFRGMVQNAVNFSDTGNARLFWICEVAGLSELRDGSENYYFSEPIVRDDPKGTGPFLKATVELYRMIQHLSHNPKSE